MKRKIVKIIDEKCTGCGDCVPNCAEGALQIIDGKARLISDLFCDGLGACLGNCPEDAILIEEREAEPYDEYKVMDYIVKGGPNVIKAHLHHLKEHNEIGYLAMALEYLRDNNIEIKQEEKPMQQHSGCPGSRSVAIETKSSSEETGKRASRLTQWPIQMHLVSPNASYFNGSDLLLAADCVSFAYGDFHKDFIEGRSLAIACPKLDSNKQVYLDKLVEMINIAKIKSITVTIMQVPCCGGLLQIAQQAVDIAERKVPINLYVIGIEGNILRQMTI